jgi:D-glycerate 3-kinase
VPDLLAEQIDILWRPLAERLAAEAKAQGRTLVAGLCGPQGAGKSTGAGIIAGLLGEAGVTSAVLSLDDLYLRKAERGRLAWDVHPLFAVRGPPGTHDVGLGLELLGALAGSGAVRVPRFDKAADDRADPAGWPLVQAPMGVVLFEGWCVGARPQPTAALAEPVNALEAEEDPRAVWRGAVNQALAGAYQTLFARIDFQVLLRPPSFGVVAGWRLEQEHKLRERTKGGMTDAEVMRFVQHYERLSRWIDAEAPARADVVVRLDEGRRATVVRGL